MVGGIAIFANRTSDATAATAATAAAAPENQQNDPSIAAASAADSGFLNDDFAGNTGGGDDNYFAGNFGFFDSGGPGYDENNYQIGDYDTEPMEIDGGMAPNEDQVPDPSGMVAENQNVAPVQENGGGGIAFAKKSTVMFATEVALAATTLVEKPLENGNDEEQQTTTIALGNGTPVGPGSSTPGAPQVRPFQSAVTPSVAPTGGTSTTTQVPMLAPTEPMVRGPVAVPPAIAMWRTVAGTETTGQPHLANPSGAGGPLLQRPMPQRPPTRVSLDPPTVAARTPQANVRVEPVHQAVAPTNAPATDSAFVFHENHRQFTAALRDSHDTETRFAKSILDSTVLLDIAMAKMLELQATMLDETDRIMALMSSPSDAEPIDSYNDTYYDTYNSTYNDDQMA